MSEYLARQLSGPLAQGTIDTVLAQYQLADGIISYWYGLSITTASAEELTAIGYLVGYPWPTAPGSTFSDRIFTLGTSATYPLSDTSHGLSGIGSLDGGFLASNSTTTGALIPIEVYRKLLASVAIAKYQGLSYSTIDLIVSSFGNMDYVYVAPLSRAFQFGTTATYPTTDTSHGFGGIGLTTGGYFTSVNPSYFPDSDVTIAFTTFLSTSNLWVLENVFLSICTSPQVFVRNGV